MKKSAHAIKKKKNTKNKKKKERKRGTRLFLYNNTTNHSRCLFIIRFKKLNNDPVYFRPYEFS